MTRIYYAITLLIISLASGIMGFVFIEGYSFVEAFYMTVITISTVGFTEVRELSETGRVFTAFYIIFNIGIFAFAVSVLTSYLFEGGVREMVNKYVNNIGYRRMKNHIIVCGYGRNGRRACLELQNSKEKFIVVDNNPEIFKNSAIMLKDMKYITGDATNDDILILAGIERAKAIISALPEDATNVFVTLTAREMNAGIKIITRAARESSEGKLRRAGADHVILPDIIGGHHMASLVTKPAVIEFIETLNGIGGDVKLHLEEFNFEEFKTEFQGKTIKELDVRKQCGITIIGVKGGQQQFNFDPGVDTTIKEGNVLIGLGQEEEIERFRSIYFK